MIRYFFTIFILGSSFSAYALDYGCRLKPHQLNDEATKRAKEANEQGRSLEDSIPIRSNVSGKINSFQDNSKNEIRGTIEGFYRPQIYGQYSLLPVPLFVVELSEVRNVLYICAHVDEDPRKTHVTIYTMLGYNIDPPDFSNFIGDFFAPAQLTIKPVSVSIIGFNEIRKKYLFWIDWFPPFKLIYENIIAAQRLITNVVSDAANFGVERITLTSDYVELAGDIDVNNPDNPGFVKKTYFDKTKK